MSRVLVALSTAPSAAVARKLARALVAERLCACVNVVPGVRSFYRWEGKLHDDRELLLVMKLPAARLPALKKRLPALHPYELPELVVLEVKDGLPGYLSWVLREASLSPE